jgi:hypothetical protein
MKRQEGTRIHQSTRRSLAGLATLLVAALAATATPAFANSPNPTSVVVDSETVNGGSVTITVSGTWTWDKRVPNGAQADCNDSRSGVGYAVSWGDNQTNPLKPKNSSEIIYVGDANDNWVHSVTHGTQTVDGPFKASSQVTESMLGETPDAVLNGFGQQGISTGASAATPTKADSEHWFSNCGPTAQSVVDGQTIGNSNPSEPTKGYPNGTWGPISHTYTTPGPHKICPVMYDPHGSKVGEHAGSLKDVIAGGTGHNDDNSVESNENPEACVVSAVTPEPAFTIQKSQEIAGSGTGFTTATLTGKVGQTVDYQIVVHNTGNVSLSFSSLSDSHCDAGTIGGGPSGPLAPGASATYTCDHVLSAADQSAGSYSNTATDTGTPPEGQGSPVTHTSNTVVVNVPTPPTPPAPAFETRKEQRLEGEASYTSAKLTARLGQKVEYKISVKDTGNTSLSLSPLSDVKCDSGTISAPSQSSIAPGEAAFYTCSHVLTSTGVYVNVAVVTATPPGEPPITHETPHVETEVPAQPAFTIQKSQEIAGSGTGLTTATLTGKVGQTVDYQIIVRNTGNTSLSFSNFSDSHCDAGTIGGGPSGPLAPGGSATYVCDHVLSAADQAAGSYSNTATDTGTPPEGQGSPVTHTSNTVVVNVPTPSEPAPSSTPPAPPAQMSPAAPAGEVRAQSQAAPALTGPQGCVRASLVARIKAAGVQSVTFYLDGHKLRTLPAKRARAGSLSIKINTGRLAVGVHRLVAKVRMSGKPGVTSRGLTIVHCASQAVSPKFTG